MADRYWVGGSATWDATAGTKWALTDGGAGGQAVPTSADDVFFTATSGAVTVTVSGSRTCNNLTCTGFTGTLAGTSTPILSFYGNVAIATGMTLSSVNFRKLGASSATFLSSGKSIQSLEINDSSGSLTLSDAFTSPASLTVTAGTFDTGDYAVTAASLLSNNGNIRAINLGSSTVTLNGAGASVGFNTSSNLTFNAGTSQINISGSGDVILNGGTGQTFYNVSVTGTAFTSFILSGTGNNTFNDLSVAGRTTVGVTAVSLSTNQTINGTLTFSAGTAATMRTFVRSSTLGTTRTLTCASVATLTDIDFRDIAIDGAAAPVSGTRLGDCKGNSGITFPAAKTVYWRSATGTNWAAATSSWSLTSGGTATHTAFPLAQDTAVFTTTYPSTGNITLNAGYNIGSIDWSARTVSNISLSTGTVSPVIYGNWIGGTGLTNAGTGQITFSGRGSQTISSVGIPFTQGITVDSPGGSVTLLDAFSTSRNSIGALVVTQGTFDANNYNVTLSGSAGTFISSVSNTRTVAIGSGTWTIVASSPNVWNATNATNLTIMGTGTINLTSASAKTFAGGGIQTYPTINQGGAGALTITGSNKFANITNTVVGTVRFSDGSTNEFGAFNLNGTSTTARLTLGNVSSGGAPQAILKKPTAWNIGTGSLDGGNNTGLSFTAGGNDFLNISYINGVVVSVGDVVTETAVFADTQSVVVTYAVAASDTVAFAETQVPAVSFSVSVTDSTTLTVTEAAASAYGVANSEAFAFLDISSVSSVFFVAVDEATAIADVQSVLVDFSVALDESLELVDDELVGSYFLAMVEDSFAISDSEEAAVGYNVFVTESASLLSSEDVTASYVELVSEQFATETQESAATAYGLDVSDTMTLVVVDFGRFLWEPIDDIQTADWQNIATTQSATWQSVDDSQSPGWVVI